MTFTVTWKPSVQKRLADIWLDATNKRKLTDSADALDHVLRHMPLQVGESRSDNLRIIVLRPLVALYEVFEEDRRVDVLSIRQIPISPPESTDR